MICPRNEGHFTDAFGWGLGGGPGPSKLAAFFNVTQITATGRSQPYLLTIHT